MHAYLILISRIFLGGLYLPLKSGNIWMNAPEYYKNFTILGLVLIRDYFYRPEYAIETEKILKKKGKRGKREVSSRPSMTQLEWTRRDYKEKAISMCKCLSKLITLTRAGMQPITFGFHGSSTHVRVRPPPGDSWTDLVRWYLPRSVDW